MHYSVTTATRKVMAMSKRIRVIQGGTSASKTISILLVLINLAQSDKTPTLTSIVSESFPHLKRGAIKDFLSIMQEHKYYKEDRWNKSDFIYTFETGSKIEFFSVDQPSKVRGPRRDRLFMNEANNTPYEAFDQLEVRTKEFVFIDYNPTNEFWYYSEVQNRDDVEHIILTYKDNEALSPEIVASIEQRKDRKGWWKVYGEGQLGEVEGKIYKDWQIIDAIPHEARLERRGLDFGYSNDPSALVDIYRYNGGFILDEVMYQKGMTNKQIADVINAQEQKVLTIADSAEPKSIDELRLYGCSVIPANKGQGSVLQGIQYIQDQRISVTKRSVNIINEYRNYLWRTDKDGKVLNEPEHQFSHCFAPNTLIKTTEGYKTIKSLVGKEGYLYSKDGLIEYFYDVKPTRNNAVMSVVTFTDGTSITVTQDHLLLLQNGEWIQASLLQGGDLIQSDMYGKTNISRDSFYKVQGFKILQRLCRWRALLDASLRLDNRKWCDTREASYPSQGRKPIEQRSGEFGMFASISASIKRIYSYLGRKAYVFTRELAEKRYARSEEVAWVKRGYRVARATWKESNGDEGVENQKLRTLWKRIFIEELRKACKILSSKLQDESTTKEVKGVTRSFCKQTYNLEVRNSHCLVANGVIAHNSMDAVRYGFNGLLEKNVGPRVRVFR